MEKAASAPPIAREVLAAVPVIEFNDAIKSIGPADSAMTITVFADLLCPACRAALSSLLTYQKNHSTRVRLVYKHQPLWTLRGHETSKAAAALSEMAGERGKFWEFADAVHAHRGQMPRERYLELMTQLGFDASAVESRLETPDDSALQRVTRDIDLAERLGIRATPTFVVRLGMHPPVAVTQRGLTKLLNSPAVMAALAQRAAAEH